MGRAILVTGWGGGGLWRGTIFRMLHAVTVTASASNIYVHSINILTSKRRSVFRKREREQRYTPMSVGRRGQEVAAADSGGWEGARQKNEGFLLSLAGAEFAESGQNSLS